MSKTQTGSSRRDAYPASRWTAAALLLVAGVATVCVALIWGAHRRLGLAQTSLAVSAVAAHVQEAQAAIAQAIQGNNDALSHFLDARKAFSDSRQLLDHGGVMYAGDRDDVMSIQSLQSLVVVWTPASAALTALDAQMQQMQDVTTGLSAGIKTLARAPQATVAAQAALTAVRRFDVWSQPQPSQVLAAAAADLAVADQSLMQRLWTQEPSSANDPVASRLNEEAVRLKEAASHAQEPPAAAAMSAFADAVSERVTALHTMSASAAYRAVAVEHLPSLQSAAATAAQALEKVQDELARQRQHYAAADYLFWLGLVATILGLIFWLHWSWSLSARQWTLTQDHRSVQETHGQLEDLTRAMRRLVDRDGVIADGARLNDEAASSTFALTAIINRILVSRETTLNYATQKMTEIERLLLSMLPLAQAVANEEGRPGLAEPMARQRAVAENLAVLAQTSSRIREDAEKAATALAQTLSIAQEDSWRTDSLREGIQAVSKRLKRVGELSQSIRAPSQSVRDIARRVQVLALNGSIEAFALGDAGRSLGVLVQEIERLAQGVAKISMEVDEFVDAIGQDARAAVETMENNAMVVIDGGRSAQRAATATAEASADVLSAKEALASVILQIEQAAVDIARTLLQAQEVATEMQRMRAAGQQQTLLVQQGRRLSIVWRQDWEQRSRTE